MCRLAIVIPFFKIDFFEETIKSLSNQTNKNFKLYIGNDGSPNDPYPLIIKYFDDEKFEYYNYKENFGGTDIARQWERILENVKEEWFVILGDDDFIENNFVEKFYTHLQNLKADINVFKVNTTLVDGQGKEIKSIMNSFNAQYYSSLEFAIMKINRRVNSSLSEHIFRLSKFKITGFPFYPLAWNTDDMIILKMSDYKLLYFIPDSRVYVRIFDGSVTGSSNNLEKKAESYEKFLIDVAKDFNTYNVPVKHIDKFINSVWRQKGNNYSHIIKKMYAYQGILGLIKYYFILPYRISYSFIRNIYRMFK